MAKKISKRFKKIISDSKNNKADKIEDVIKLVKKN